jgi:hypothetical protein
MVNNLSINNGITTHGLINQCYSISTTTVMPYSIVIPCNQRCGKQPLWGGWISLRG